MPLKNDLRFRNSEIDNNTGTEINLNNFKNENSKTAIIEKNSKGTICCFGMHEQDLLIKGLSLLNLVNLVEFDRRDTNNIKQLYDDDKLPNSNVSRISNFDNNVQKNFKIDNKEISGKGDSTKLITKDSSNEQSSSSEYQVLYLETIYDDDSERELRVTEVENSYNPRQIPKYINNKKKFQQSQYSSSDNLCITPEFSDNVNYNHYDSNEQCEYYENSTTLSEETEIYSDNLMSDDTEKCDTKPDQNVCTLKEFCQQFKLLYVPKKIPKCGTQSCNTEKNCVNNEYCKKVEGGLCPHLKNFKHKLKFPPIPEQPSTISCQVSPILCAALSNQSVRKRESVFSKFIRRCRGQKRKKTRTVRKCVGKCKEASPELYADGMEVEARTSQTTKPSRCVNISTLTNKCAHKRFTPNPCVELGNQYSSSSSLCECEVPISNTAQSNLPELTNSCQHSPDKQSAVIGIPFCIRDALKAPKKNPYYTAQSNDKLSKKENTKNKGITCASVAKSKIMISRKVSCAEPIIKTVSAQNSCSILLPPKTNQKEPIYGKIKETDSCTKCRNAKKTFTQERGITCQHQEQKKQLVSTCVDSLPPNVKCSVQVSCSDLDVKPKPSINECQLGKKPSVYERGVSCHSLEDKKKTKKKLSCTSTLGRKSSSQTLYSSILAIIRGKEAAASKPKVPCKYKTATKCGESVCVQSMEDKKICISQKISCTQPSIKQYSVQVSCTNLLESLRPKISTCVGPDQNLDINKSNKSCGETVIISPQQAIKKHSVQISCSSLIPSKNCTCASTNTFTEPSKITKQCVQNLTSGNESIPLANNTWNTLYGKEDNTTKEANCKDCSELSNSINKFFQLLGSIIGKEEGQQDEYPDLQAIRNPNYRRFDNLTFNSSKTSTDCSNDGLLEKFHSKLINNLIHQLYNDNEYEKLDSRIKKLDTALQNTIIEPYLSYLKNQNEDDEKQEIKQRNQHCKKKDKRKKEDLPKLQMETTNYQKQLPIKGREKLCLCQIQSMEISNGLRKRNIIKVCDISKVNNKKLKEEDVLKKADHNYYYNSFLPTKVENTKKLPITYYDFIQKKSKRNRKKKTTELGESIDRSACSPVPNLSNHLIPSSSCSVCKEERELACTSTLEAPSLFGPKPPQIVKLRSKTRKRC